MKNLNLAALVGLLTWQMSLNVVALEGLDVEKIAQQNHIKIKRLEKANRTLLNDIERLLQQQKINQQKIAELFRLLEYKKSDSATKAAVLRIREEDKKARETYTNARSLLLTKQYTQAIDLFLNYLTNYPQNNHAADTHYWLGKAYTLKGDYQSGKQAFIDFQQNYPSNHKFAISLYELALIQHQLKDNAAAMQLLTTMIKKFPTHKSIFQAKALLTQLQDADLATDVKSKKIKAK